MVRLPGKEPRTAGDLLSEYAQEIQSGGDKEKHHIMVTLMGDPNMGKSSVINTIFGKKVCSLYVCHLGLCVYGLGLVCICISHHGHAHG